MKKASNQKIEQHYFNWFREAYRDLPRGEIVFSDKPDVIIKGKKTIGIEISNFYIQNGFLAESEQYQRSLRGKIVQRAHERYLKSGGKHIDMSFQFANVTAQKLKCLTEKLVKLARIVENKSGLLFKEEFLMDFPEVISIYVNQSVYENPVWRVSQVFREQNMSLERLTAVIKEKEEKSKHYQKCDEFWLLLIIDFIDPAQDQELPVTSPPILSEVFKKILIFKTTFNEIMEIS